MSSPRRPIFRRPTGPPLVSVLRYATAATRASRQAAAGSETGFSRGLRSNVRWEVALRSMYSVRRCFWLKYVWIAVNGSSQRQTTTTQASVRTPATSRNVPRRRTPRRTPLIPSSVGLLPDILESDWSVTGKGFGGGDETGTAEPDNVRRQWGHEA